MSSDPCFSSFSGLVVGEVDLDGRGALGGHLLTEFVAVLAGRQQQGYLLSGDLGPEDLDLRRRVGIS